MCVIAMTHDNRSMRMLKYLLFFFCASIVGFRCSECLGQYSVDDLVRLNRDTWKSFTTIDTEYAISTVFKINGESTTYVYENNQWIRSGVNNRIMTTSKTNDDELRFIEYLFKDGKRYQKYGKWSEYFVRSKSFCGVKPQIGANMLRAESSECYGFLPFTIETVGYTVRTRELISDFVKKCDATIIGDVRSDKGDNLIIVRATHKAVSGDDRNAGSHIDLYFNADKNFLVHKAVHYLTGLGKSAETGKFVPIIINHEVMEYAEITGGLYFPKQIRFINFNGTDTSEDKAVAITTVLFRNIRVNSSIDDEMLGFSLPKWSLVLEYLTDSDEADNYIIWGEDNKSLVTFTSNEQLTDYVVSKCGSGFRQNNDINDFKTHSIDIYRLIFIVLALMFIFLGLWFEWRKRNKGKNV
jgi:hypothetical protein